MRLEVTVHHVAQAKAALRLAENAGVAIQLRSASGAASAVGVDYLRALGDAAGHELLIDCADDAGLVMAALRTGCRKLAFSGSKDEWERLDQMAGKAGAVLAAPMDPPDDGVVLPADDDDAEALRTWFASHPG